MLIETNPVLLNTSDTLVFNFLNEILKIIKLNKIKR